MSIASRTFPNIILCWEQPLLAGVSIPGHTIALLYRQFKSDPLTHSAIAFEVQGGWRDVKASVIATVLQFLVGGGGSFSSGGPGKAYSGCAGYLA